MTSDRSLTGRLIHVARLCRTARARTLLRHGIFAGQDNLLKCLAQGDGQTMGALAHSLGVSPPTITKMVTRLAAQGMVRREDSKLDSRLCHVFITEAGKLLIEKIDNARAKAEAKALDGLKDKDVKRLGKLVDRLLDNLERKKK